MTLHQTEVFAIIVLMLVLFVTDRLRYDLVARNGQVDAARQALRQMIDWVVALTGIPKDEAYALCSFACDLHVTQTVNNVKGVHAMIAKSILEKPAA